MRMAARLEAMGVEKYASTTRKSGHRSVWTGKIQLDYGALSAPLRWRKPRMIFVNSMSDLFHEGVPDTFIDAVWDVMEGASRHQFQVLTKRPDRLAKFLSRRRHVAANVWVGTSVESSAYVSRIDAIRDVPAVVRFISFEPLLGEVDRPNLKGIDWIIVGGESGPGARPIAPEWVDALLGAARQVGSSFFFKQWGGPIKKKTGRRLHGRVYSEFPTPVPPHLRPLLNRRQLKAA
jgi:protein gp37